MPSAASVNPMPQGGPNSNSIGNQLQSYIVGAFSGTTYMPNSLDVQHEPLYDVQWNPATAAPWAAGATIPGGGLAQFFTTGSTTGKTIADTNVATGKKLDAPEAFAVMAIGVDFAPNTLLADLIAIRNNLNFEFYIGNKWYNRGPVQFYVPGMGFPGISNISGAASLSNGVPGKNGRHTLSINIIIDNQASFYCQFNGTAVVLTASGSGGTGVNVKAVLDGLHARGVQ